VGPACVGTAYVGVRHWAEARVRHEEPVMRTTLLGFSLGMIMIGAIMAWAVTVEFAGFDINRAGVIIVMTGMALAGLSFIPTRTRRRVETSHDVLGEDGQVAHEHDVVVEENGPA
jgi:hypothetical protein